MRDHDGRLTFAPRLPGRISRLKFALLWRGVRLRVTVNRTETTYEVHGGEHDGEPSVELMHYGEPLVVTAPRPVTRPIPPMRPPGPTPRQPLGREPARRGLRS